MIFLRDSVYHEGRGQIPLARDNNWRACQPSCRNGSNGAAARSPSYDVTVATLRAGGPLIEAVEKAGIRRAEFPKHRTKLSFQVPGSLPACAYPVVSASHYM